MSRRILIIEDEDDFRQKFIGWRDYFGFLPDDELQGFGTRQAVSDYMDKLVYQHTGQKEKPLIDIALIDLALNEKPSIAYANIKRANELEGIELFEKYGKFFRKKIFVTGAGNYRKAAQMGFNFNRPDIQVCLKTNSVEAKEEDRFPNNLIRAIKNVYAALDEEDAGQGETRDD
ncbi:MAG: hypothetical protein RKO66_09430 [Candidatus Contendobacter sp.]|nr:hypothetical protein [Candidatus Contendobacter sp.]MDS4059096.1 hypothetical protein [Candidatus Contendobacter sp.]